MGAKICNALEMARWVLIVAGFQLAFFWGTDAVTRFEILAPLVIVPLSGLTGLESVVFGKYAREQSGYGGSGRYQKQSGFNNLAVAIATAIAWWCGWGIMAYAALMTAALVFYGMSAVNHALSAVLDGNRNWKNAARPFMTLLLIIAVLWIMLPALQHG